MIYMSYVKWHFVFVIAIGPKFWKTSKQIRAVKLSEYRKHNPAAFQGSSSDSDFELPPRKHSKILKSKERDLIEERLQKLEQELSISNEDESCRNAWKRQEAEGSWGSLW